MKHSLRLKFTLLLSGAIVFTLVASWVINRSFLPIYYQYSKVKALDSTYEQVNALIGMIKEDEALTEEMIQTIDRLGSNNNVNIYIFNGSLHAIYLSSSTDRQIERVVRSIQAYRFGPLPFLEIGEIAEIKIEEGHYDVYKQFDIKTQTSYMDLNGYLDNEYMVFFRSNFQSIQDNVVISNKFLTYVGIVTTLLGATAMYFISKRFTKPILELSDIAKKISDLDFDATYTVTSQDEIGVLGNCINTLSERLEQTISELKRANNELQTDIEHKIQIDEMRKEFLSNVTHELKTPIALIQGYAEGLMENINEDDESRDFYCEVIIDEAMKMNHMVKKLLSLNQIEFGTNSMEFERFNIVSLIQSVLSSNDILIKQKGIHLYFEQQDAMFVWADQCMIEEVITNYISNAMNHMDERKILEVKVVLLNNVIRVAVFNTGERIPNEELDKIWIKFYKVDKARTREYGGSGIGLSIVKAIMTSHHRECGVVNHNTGVEFWFELDATN